MSRETKFRVWDKSRKEMVSDIRLSGLLNKKLACDNLEFLQYTGLKDKNGVDLYCGDIYRKWGQVFKCEFEQAIYEKQECTLTDGDFEIIGNIYESPELLSGNQ